MSAKADFSFAFNIIPFLPFQVLLTNSLKRSTVHKAKQNWNTLYIVSEKNVLYCPQSFVKKGKYGKERKKKATSIYSKLCAVG